MKDIDDMVQAYELALRSGKAKVSRRMSIQEQVAKYRRSQQMNQIIITQTRDVLAMFGVTTIMYPFYIDFALKVWGLQCRGVCGHDLEREVQALIRGWVRRGLELEVLDEIRTGVLNISEPPGPESPLPE